MCPYNFKLSNRCLTHCVIYNFYGRKTLCNVVASMLATSLVLLASTLANKIILSPVRTELAINSQVSLVAAEDGQKLYLKAGAEQSILGARRELFSFGSGTWMDGSDAVQAMADASGQRLKCSISLDSMIILEKRKIPQHLSELSCLDKPVKLRELLLALEDQGEAPWQKITNHQIIITMFSLRTNTWKL